MFSWQTYTHISHFLWQRNYNIININLFFVWTYFRDRRTDIHLHFSFFKYNHKIIITITLLNMDISCQNQMMIIIYHINNYIFTVHINILMTFMTYIFIFYGYILYKRNSIHYIHNIIYLTRLSHIMLP